MKMITHIYFDFYDVLHVDPLNKWLSDSGLKREGEIEQITKKHDRGLLDQEEFIDELSKISGQQSQDILDAFIRSRSFDDKLIELIEQLKPNYYVGLISNSAGPGIRSLMQNKNIESLFNDIIVSGEVGFIKPEKEIFDYALSLSGSNSNESLFIDDNPHNIEAVISYGWDGMIYTGLEDLKTELSRRNITTSV